MVKRIVIADDEPITRMDIRELLQESGYEVVAEASDGFEAIDACKLHNPDLVIMDIRMPVLDGLKACKKITHDKLAGGILILSAFYDKEFIEKAKQVGVLGYQVKPLDEKSFIPTIEMCIAKAEEIKALEKEIQKTSQKLEDRKSIDIAKGLLIKEHDISEEEAYNMLRKMSMDRRCSIGEIARTIMVIYE
ncbi:ANTAR domain-containing response regulator [Pontibacillus litoralis]|uniref:Fis family transcriptional regulator n=1 Tax=Pontibacillus litoralis JSM 072002 TaxID=1385512 RepID=A0A0A5FUT2_9BACI|nr:response regulator [Pontibacillus litoralis]KGX84501.1 Fis family transcriptional regulator [Pontibacillus litoralis JSM 072002]